jgi:hypothetical protein
MIVFSQAMPGRPRRVTRPGLTAALIRLSLVAALTCSLGTMAAAAAELYRAQTMMSFDRASAAPL